MKPGVLSDSRFGEGTAPSTTAQRIFYNTETGELSFLINGSGGGLAGEIPVFAILPANLHLSATNFTIVPA